MSQFNNNKNIKNIMVCGYVNTGKTSLVNHIVTGQWESDLSSTDMIIPGWKKRVSRIRFHNNLKFNVSRDVDEDEINKYDMFVVVHDNNALSRAYAKELSKLIPDHKRILVYSKNDSYYENEDKSMGEKTLIVSAKTGKNVNKLVKMLMN